MKYLFYFHKFGPSRIPDLLPQDEFAIYMSYPFLGNFPLLGLYGLFVAHMKTKLYGLDGIGYCM
jgi:hypothetical protein